jgi:hypothetical protein
LSTNYALLIVKNDFLSLKLTSIPSKTPPKHLKNPVFIPKTIKNPIKNPSDALF